jgi:hypothetical protein
VGVGSLTLDRLSGRKNAVVGALPGSFLRTRSKTWIVEDCQTMGQIPTLDLVCVEDDSQGETLQIAIASEIGAQILDPNDWSSLYQTSFEGPERLGAYLRATEWRTASAADRKLFQAPFRAGIRLDAYQLLPLAKAVIELVCEAAGINKPHFGKAQRRQNEIDLTKADVSALYYAVGWKPQTTLAAGLREMVKCRAGS